MSSAEAPFHRGDIVTLYGQGCWFCCLRAEHEPEYRHGEWWYGSTEIRDMYRPATREDFDRWLETLQRDADHFNGALSKAQAIHNEWLSAAWDQYRHHLPIEPSGKARRPSNVTEP